MSGLRRSALGPIGQVSKDMSSETESITTGARRRLARAFALVLPLALATCAGTPAEEPPSPRPAAEAPPRPEARTADLPLDAELARRLAALADRIEAEPAATAKLLAQAGLPLDGYVERLHAVALDPRLAAIYVEARRPPDVAAMAHVLDDADD